MDKRNDYVMGAIKLSIEISGLRSLLRMLGNPEGELYGVPWQRGMEEMGQQGGALARRGAPRLRGDTAGSISYDVQKRVFPQWVAIRVKATRKSRAYPSGFSYPRLLAFSPKHGHKDWLLNSLQPLLSGAGQALAKIGEHIARNWERG